MSFFFLMNMVVRKYICLSSRKSELTKDVFSHESFSCWQPSRFEQGPPRLEGQRQGVLLEGQDQLFDNQLKAFLPPEPERERQASVEMMHLLPLIFIRRGS